MIAPKGPTPAHTARTESSLYIKFKGLRSACQGTVLVPKPVFLHVFSGLWQAVLFSELHHQRVGKPEVVVFNARERF
jgi:hypothetical protein